MRRCRGFLARTAAAAMGMFLLAGPVLAQDALPSWNDTGSKKALLGFVECATKKGSPDFVPPEERVATFDNDGTLWGEQPLYFQLVFAIDRVKALAPQHPEWKDAGAVQGSCSKGDMKAALAGGEQGWSKSRGHPRRHDDRGVRADRQGLARDRGHRAPAALHRLVYQPMLELLGLSPRQRLQDLHRLRRRHRVHAALDREASTASRPSRSSVSRVETIRDARRQAGAGQACRKVDFVDDKAGKPVGITLHRPPADRRLRQLRRRPRRCCSGRRPATAPR